MLHQRGHDWEHEPSIAVASTKKPLEREARSLILAMYDYLAAY
jgi:hypothetical protein